MHYIDYTAFNSTTAQLKTITVTLQCASYTFRHVHGHPQGSVQQRNTIMTDSVTDVHAWSQITLCSIKTVNIFQI